MTGAPRPPARSDANSKYTLVVPNNQAWMNFASSQKTTLEAMKQNQKARLTGVSKPVASAAPPLCRRLVLVRSARACGQASSRVTR